MAGTATMPRMTTAIVSDLHLGILSGGDLARRPEALERLAGAVADADHVVLLGDVLEMRERRVADLVALAAPVFAAIGRATAGRRLTILPGNHDHALAAPWLDRLQLEGGTLGPEQRWELSPEDGPLGRLRNHLPDTHVTVAYPGLRLRPDVYATHGHYLDLPLTVPRIESVAASALARFTGRGAVQGSAAEYEATLSPLYALLGGLAENAPDAALRKGGNVSRAVWSRANGSRPLGRLLLTRGALPAAVALLNRIGVGPLRSGVTGEHLRAGGLAAMREVAPALAPDAQHLVFGHTHRVGPLPGDDPSEWLTATGTRLWNTGSWCLEPTFLGPPDDPGPYRPGHVTYLDESGPPRIEHVLDGVPLTR